MKLENKRGGGTKNIKRKKNLKMKKNKNINKNTHHKSYIKVIIVKFTQDTRADIIKEKKEA